MKNQIIISVAGTACSGTTTIAHLIQKRLNDFDIESTLTDRDGVSMTYPVIARNMEQMIKDGKLSVHIETVPLNRKSLS